MCGTLHPISYCFNCSNDEFEHKSCGFELPVTIVVDKACNGCGNTFASQNIWHLMTRIFTVWTALESIGKHGNVNVVFTRRKSVGLVSNQAWSLIGTLSSEMHCSRLNIRPMIPPPYNKYVKKRIEFSKMILPDKLWSLSSKRFDCKGMYRVSWQRFTLAYLNHFSIPKKYGNERCLLLRVPVSNGTSFSSRREANVPELLEKLNNFRPVYFDYKDGLKTHVEQIRRCSLVFGIHGAQFMNTMWMEPGNVIEYDYPNTHNHYYYNIAQLSGHTYTGRLICSNNCSAFQTKNGVYFHPELLNF